MGARSTALDTLSPASRPRRLGLRHRPSAVKKCAVLHGAWWNAGTQVVAWTAAQPRAGTPARLAVFVETGCRVSGASAGQLAGQEVTPTPAREPGGDPRARGDYADGRREIGAADAVMPPSSCPRQVTPMHADDDHDRGGAERYPGGTPSRVGDGEGRRGSNISAAIFGGRVLRRSSSRVTGTIGEPDGAARAGPVLGGGLVARQDPRSRTRRLDGAIDAAPRCERCAR